MNSLILVTVLFFATPPTTLKHRTAPPIHEETCRDHLARIQVSLLHLTDPTGNFAKHDPESARNIHQQAMAINPAIDGLPTSPFCTKKELDKLDIFNALLGLEDAEMGLP